MLKQRNTFFFLFVLTVSATTAVCGRLTDIYRQQYHTVIITAGVIEALSGTLVYSKN